MNPLDCRQKLINEMQRRYGCVQNVAEDVVDEAIYRVLKIELRVENVFPLLYQISKNLAMDTKKRSEVARRNGRIILNSVKQTETPLQETISSELEKSFREELLSLRERERKAFELFHLDGLSHEEIATKIGVTVASSKTMVFRAKQALKVRLKRFAS
jgi:RNA polymerase sigma-70 factor (ECF subfamily)